MMKERRFSAAAIQREKLGRRETFADIARRMPKHELYRLTTMKQLQAAKAIGISPTTLKKLCRHYGIPRWPFRKIVSTEQAADRLAALLPETPEQQQQQSTVKPTSRVEGHQHHHQDSAVGGSTVPRATSTHEPFRYGINTTNNLCRNGKPAIHSVGAARGGTVFVDHPIPSPTPSPALPPASPPPRHLLKRCGGGDGTKNVSICFTSYDDLVHSFPPGGRPFV